MDRPIGIAEPPRNNEFYEYWDTGLLLTREAVELSLQSGNERWRLRYQDNPAQTGVLGGDYTLDLWLERIN